MNTFPDGFFTPPQIIIVNNQFYIYQYNEEFNTEKYYVYQVIPGKAMYSFLECQFFFFLILHIWCFSIIRSLLGQIVVNSESQSELYRAFVSSRADDEQFSI